MSAFNPADPNGDQARINRLAFLMRDLAEAGQFILHPDHDAASCRDMADAIVTAINHLAEVQVMLLDSEMERLRAAYEHARQRREAKK